MPGLTGRALLLVVVASAVLGLVSLGLLSGIRRLVRVTAAAAVVCVLWAWGAAQYYPDRPASVSSTRVVLAGIGWAPAGTLMGDRR